MDDDYVNIKFFDLNADFSPNPNNFLNKGNATKLLFVARPGSGKSHLIKYLNWKLHKLIPIVRVFSHSAAFNNDYDFVPDIFISNKVTLEALRNVINRQKHAVKHLENPNLALILDDVADDKKIWNSKEMRALLFNGRHFFNLLFVTTQYSKSISCDIRNMFDYIFIFKDNNRENQKKNYESFCKIIPSFDMFLKIMNTLPQYGVLVVINNIQPQNWMDSLRWFKALEEIPTDFKSCNKIAWLQNDERKKNDDDIFSF